MTEGIFRGWILFPHIWRRNAQEGESINPTRIFLSWDATLHIYGCKIASFTRFTTPCGATFLLESRWSTWNYNGGAWIARRLLNPPQNSKRRHIQYPTTLNRTFLEDFLKNCSIVTQHVQLTKAAYQVRNQTTPNRSLALKWPTETHGVGNFALKIRPALGLVKLKL